MRRGIEGGFCALRGRFWEFVESRVDSVVLQNRGWILRFACEILRFEILGFCGIVESLVDLSL